MFSFLSLRATRASIGLSGSAVDRRDSAGSAPAARARDQGPEDVDRAHVGRHDRDVPGRPRPR